MGRQGRGKHKSAGMRWSYLTRAVPRRGGTNEREGGAGGGDGVGGPHLEDEAVSKAGVSLQLGITKDSCMQVLRTWARGRA